LHRADARAALELPFIFKLETGLGLASSTAGFACAGKLRSLLLIDRAPSHRASSSAARYAPGRRKRTRAPASHTAPADALPSSDEPIPLRWLSCPE